jgi:septal ring factor EnvC (AmiA/AmiB activator)
MPRFLIILVIALLGASGGNAAKKKQRTIRSAQTEQQATQKKIKETTKKLNDNSAQTEKELNKLNLLRGEITQKERQILETRSQIDTLSNSITKAQDQLDDLNNRLEQLKNAYKTALRRLQGTQYATNELAYIFGSESFTKAYSRIRYTQEFANWRRRKSKEIKETLAKIEQKKAQLATLHSERATSLSALSSDQAILKAKQDETDKTVAKLQRDGVNLQRALDKEKKRLKSIDNEISKMIEVERREREQQKKKQQDQKKGGTTKQKDSKTTPAKSKGGTTATKPKTKIDNSDPDAAMTSKFAAGKGSMLFPVASPYRIVAKYGSSNGQPYNTGIEIVLDGSANVRSIFEGTVSRIFQNHDGNYSIMVRHGAYITVYYNIGSLSVKAKEKVTAGQTLGRAATDARYGKPMLHFEVRKGSETLNPLSWVR